MVRLLATLFLAAGLLPAQTFPGYFAYRWDAKTGKILLEIDKLGVEFLYVSSLAAGVGSNDIGLDRGQLGATRIVKFERSGNKILLMQPNLGFRALSRDEYERRAVEDSFAQSVLWGFPVESENDGKPTIDLTPFLLRDAHNATGALQRSRQGTYRVDPTRSAIYLPRTKNFPKNTEFEATITMTGEPTGMFVRDVAASPDAITVRQHHSFVELPGPGYEPREFDPRAGYSGPSYYDFATPLDQPLVKKFISRHRLKKGGSITYYLDRGAPEPVRSALLEGARWWNEAFEAAGFPNGFKVELLPEGADSMDVRYNVIQWVHRATRGWSYGSSVRDPRTGEILKGHVTLDSLRVRQDFLIGQGLLAPYEAGKPVDPKVVEMCLARLRQLSAHEVGHTLGLSHSYAASSYGRGSVMDYPHPVIALPSGDGAPGVDDAYAKGMGEWDKVAIAWGYGESTVQQRRDLLAKAHARGVYFLTDADARPEGSAHPHTHLWDNGADPVAELKRMMALRKRVIERFGEKSIPEWAPMATLEDVLVPAYLMNRYQIEGVAKIVGGLDYRYALRGDGQSTTALIAGDKQRAALDTVLAALSPESLTIPERILKLIPPRPSGVTASRELFRGRTGLTFDAIAPAEAAANHIAGLLLHPERAARLVEYHARDAKLPSLDETLDKILAATLRAPAAVGLQREVQYAVNRVVLTHLMNLAVDESAPARVRDIALAKVESLDRARTPESRLITKFFENPKEFRLPKPLDPPPGQPIGELCGQP